MGAYEGSGVHIGGIGERCRCRNRNLEGPLQINFHHSTIYLCFIVVLQVGRRWTGSHSLQVKVGLTMYLLTP
jgi:hypothetical protein